MTFVVFVVFLLVVIVVGAVLGILFDPGAVQAVVEKEKAKELAKSQCPFCRSEEILIEENRTEWVYTDSSPASMLTNLFIAGTGLNQDVQKSATCLSCWHTWETH